MRRSRALPAGVLLTLLVAAPAVASHIQPELVDAGESCGPLAPGTVELIVALPQDVGAITEGDFTVDVELDGSVGDGSVSFSGASLPIKAAVVAGTDGGNLYTYEEPVMEDDGLVAPDGGPIQDVSFCYVGGEDAATAAPDETAEATGDAQGDGGEASPPATDTAPTPAGGTGAGLVLMALGAITLIAGLGLQAARQPVRIRRR